MKLEHRGEYPPEWPLISEWVKRAAHGRCIRCNAAHDPERGFCLTVHHLDGDKSNVRWWNLLALCQRCHLHIQGVVLPERPWFLEHSPWFKVYVAGFYAFYYRQLELSRSAIEADLERCLRMGQYWLPEVVEK